MLVPVYLKLSRHISRGAVRDVCREKNKIKSLPYALCMHRNTEPSPRYHEEKSIVDQSVIGLRNKQNPRFFLFIYTTCGLDHHSRLEYVIQEKSRDYRRHMYIHTHPWLSDGKKTRQSVGITNKTLPCMLLPERAIYRTRFECTRVYIPMILHVPAVI